MKGRGMLIDCWTGWCAPRMAKMPRRKTLDQRRHGDGLEVIGVNFDYDRATAERLVKTLDLPWPQVPVPSDDRTRRLWGDANGCQNLPHLHVIDREGVLRWDGAPGDLDERAAALLDAPRPRR
jgi:hypothetical protein